MLKRRQIILIYPEVQLNSAAKSRWEKNIVGLESKTDGFWIMTISEVTVVLG